MPNRRIRSVFGLIIATSAASLVAGCAAGPRPLSIEEQTWFDIAKRPSDIVGAPPPWAYPAPVPYPQHEFVPIAPRG